VVTISPNFPWYIWMLIIWLVPNGLIILALLAGYFIDWMQNVRSGN